MIFPIRAQCFGGRKADQFKVSKPTMSAHFAILREAGLVVPEKHGRTVVYQLQLSVLEGALLGFARWFGRELNMKAQPAAAPDGARAAEA